MKETIVWWTDISILPPTQISKRCLCSTNFIYCRYTGKASFTSLGKLLLEKYMDFPEDMDNSSPQNNSIRQHNTQIISPSSSAIQILLRWSQINGSRIKTLLACKGIPSKGKRSTQYLCNCIALFSRSSSYAIRRKPEMKKTNFTTKHPTGTSGRHRN